MRNLELGEAREGAKGEVLTGAAGLDGIVIGGSGSRSRPNAGLIQA
jgi:hypothetical protein